MLIKCTKKRRKKSKWKERTTNGGKLIKRKKQVPDYVQCPMSNVIITATTAVVKYKKAKKKKKRKAKWAKREWKNDFEWDININEFWTEMVNFV